MDNSFMLSELKYLPWDSAFFNLKVGSIFWNSAMNITSLKEQALFQQYDLIYIFAPYQTIGINSKHVDSKVVYSKSLGKGHQYASIMLADYNRDVEDLHKLALISGKYSRFKIDNQFPKHSYERMYEEWIEKSMNGELADYVFVHKLNGHLDGMITIKLSNNIATIGLIAVDYDSQGKGIATQLIQSAEHCLSLLGTIDTLKVTTQQSNKIACKLYLKNNFAIESITDIYHCWIS